MTHTHVSLTFHHLIFTDRKQIGMTCGDCQSTHGRDVTGEREFERTRSEIPDLVHVHDVRIHTCTYKAS